MLIEARNAEAVMHRVASFPPSRTLHELFQRVAVELTRESFPQDARWDNSSLMSILRSVVEFRVRSPLLCDGGAAKSLLEFVALRIVPDSCTLDEAAYVVSSLARLKTLVADSGPCMNVACQFVDEVLKGFKCGDAPSVNVLATFAWGVVELLGSSTDGRAQKAISGAIEYIAAYQIQELRIPDAIVIIRAIAQCEGVEGVGDFWSALAGSRCLAGMDKSSIKPLVKSLEQPSSVSYCVWGSILSTMTINSIVKNLSPGDLANVLRTAIVPIRYESNVNTRDLAVQVFRYIESEPQGRIGPSHMVDICWSLSIRCHPPTAAILGDLVSLGTAVAQGHGSIPDVSLGRLAETLARTAVSRGSVLPGVLDFFNHVVAKRQWKAKPAAQMVVEAVAHISDRRVIGDRQARALLQGTLTGVCGGAVKPEKTLQVLVRAQVDLNLDCLTRQQRCELERARADAHCAIAKILGRESSDNLVQELQEEIQNRGLELRVSSTWRCPQSLCIADITVLRQQTDDPVLFVDMDGSPYDLWSYERQLRYGLLSAVYGESTIMRSSDEGASRALSLMGGPTDMIVSDQQPLERTCASLIERAMSRLDPVA